MVITSHAENEAQQKQSGKQTDGRLVSLVSILKHGGSSEFKHSE